MKLQRNLGGQHQDDGWGSWSQLLVNGSYGECENMDKMDWLMALSSFLCRAN